MKRYAAISATGPATRPIMTAPRPLSTRARIAVRATPIRRLREPRQRGAEREDAPADGRHRTHQRAGLLLAADQLGQPDRLEGLEDDQRGGPEDLDQHQARSTRLLPQQPEPVADHERRLADRVGRAPGAGRVDVRAGSFIRTTTATRWTTLSAAQHQQRQQQRASRPERVPGDQPAGDQRRRAAIEPPSDGALARRAPGRRRRRARSTWTVSTYHASSGPESSARKTP